MPSTLTIKLRSSSSTLPSSGENGKEQGVSLHQDDQNEDCNAAVTAVATSVDLRNEQSAEPSRETSLVQLEEQMFLHEYSLDNLNTRKHQIEKQLELGR